MLSWHVHACMHVSVIICVPPFPWMMCDIQWGEIQLAAPYTWSHQPWGTKRSWPPISRMAANGALSIGGLCMLCSEGFFHVNFRVWDVIVMQNVGAQRNDGCSFSMIIYPVPHCWNGSWRLSGPYHLHMPHHWQEKMCSQCSPANNNRYKA